MEDHAFIRGDGVAEPLGILNAACAVAVTTATNNVFAYADSLAMRARFQSTGGQPVWIIHPGVWPDIGIFEIGTGGGVWQANARDEMAERLLGYPILESEHMPQDDNDDVILADLSAYLIFDRAQMSIAFSEHAAFTTDKATWRFRKRLDGQPWLRSTITLADPTGSYTVSPFVYHDD
jgi:HK97 family phage major capsid protein